MTSWRCLRAWRVLERQQVDAPPLMTVDVRVASAELWAGQTPRALAWAVRRAGWGRERPTSGLRASAAHTAAARAVVGRVASLPPARPWLAAPKTSSTHMCRRLARGLSHPPPSARSAGRLTSATRCSANEPGLCGRAGGSLAPLPRAGGCVWPCLLIPRRASLPLHLQRPHARTAPTFTL